jgi:hypothetical protein
MDNKIDNDIKTDLDNTSHISFEMDEDQDMAHNGDGGKDTNITERVGGDAGIAGNETAEYAKDGAMPGNEEERPSHADWCTSLTHFRRCTKEPQWKRSNDWI